MKENKYIVYVDEEWIRLKVFAQYPSPTAREYAECRLSILKDVMHGIDKVLTNEAPFSIFFTVSFIGPDGKRHHAVEIKRIPTDGSHRPGKVLKRVKVLRKAISNRKSLNRKS